MRLKSLFEEFDVQVEEETLEYLEGYIKSDDSDVVELRDLILSLVPDMEAHDRILRGGSNVGQSSFELDSFGPHLLGFKSE